MNAMLTEFPIWPGVTETLQESLRYCDDGLEDFRNLMVELDEQFQNH